jgi:hypothetical protein
MPSKKFVPTDQQKHIVAQLCGAKMSWDSLRLLILNPATNKPISKETLQSAREELAVGKARVQSILIRSFIDLVEDRQGNSNARWSATMWGLERLCGFNPSNIAMRVGASGDDGQKTIRLEFVQPDPKNWQDDEPKALPGRPGGAERGPPAPDPYARERRDYPSQQPEPPARQDYDLDMSLKGDLPAGGVPPRRKGFDWS